MKNRFGYFRHAFSPATGYLGYYHAGVPLILTDLVEADRPFYRKQADGNVQSTPLVQQLFLAKAGGGETVLTVFLGRDAVNLKPQRASRGEAILAQVGRPLLYGVNGLYDVTQDLLVSWEGINWRWLDSELRPASYRAATDNVVFSDSDKQAASDGVVVGLAARLAVELSEAPWVLQIRTRYYRDHLGYREHAPQQWRPKLTPITGWCSWEAFGKAIDAPALAKSVEFVRRELAPYGLEYVQVDDGYQGHTPTSSDQINLSEVWLNPNDRFPKGHESIQGVIADAGLVPGIWTSAAVTDESFAGRDGNCLVDKQGQLVNKPWVNFVPSCEPAFLEREVLPLFQGLRKLGYSYFKADSLRHLWYEGLLGAVEEGFFPHEEAELRFRHYLETLRQGIGEQAFLLSCWGVLTQVIGLADACRVASDANTTWGSFQMQVFETARWFHTQRILFQLDPDHVCARSTPEWTRSLLSLVSQTGGLYMLSDNVDCYDETRLGMIRKTMPTQPVMTAETGPLRLDRVASGYTPGAWRIDESVTLQEALQISASPLDDLQDHSFGNLWATHYQVGPRRWCVVTRVATLPLQRGSLGLEKLGLDPSGTYHGFDFWAQRYLGEQHGSLDLSQVALGNCQVITLVPLVAHPAYLADNRHISMGLQFVAGEQWQGETLLLELHGVAGKTFRCWLTVPQGFRPQAPSGVGLEAKLGPFAATDGVVFLDLTFEQTLGRVEVPFTTPPRHA